MDIIAIFVGIFVVLVVCFIPVFGVITLGIVIYHAIDFGRIKREQKEAAGV